MTYIVEVTTAEQCAQLFGENMARGTFIQVHGTSGAGKTTLMRQVMGAAVQIPEPVHIMHSWVERKTGKPKSRQFVLGHYYVTPSNNKFFVAGSYGATCGGLDSLSAPGIADTFYPALMEIADGGTDVLMEGLIQMSMGRALDLVQRGYAVSAIFLDTDLETCIARVNQRRAAAGKGPLENEENTRIKFEDKPRIAGKLEEGGVAVRWASCEEAVQQLVEYLNHD